MTSGFLCEIEVAEGVEPLAIDELRMVSAGVDQITIKKGEISFRYTGQLIDLLNLKLASAVYIIEQYDIPRPKALLGHENFHRLLKSITTVLDMSPESYASFYISAAGSNTSIMQRLKIELSSHTHLKIGHNTGDLWLRLRRSKNKWDVLIRLTPRPQSARDWRVCNMEGAINAPVAHAMVVLSNPLPQDIFINLTCGSGTIMIERASHSPYQQIIGYDIDVTALNCASKNIAAANLGDKHIQLLQGNATKLSLPDASVDSICADLPFGQLVGSHAGNLKLYPQIMAEAARILKPGKRCIVITHEIRLMESLLETLPEWHVADVNKVSLRGVHPRIFSLIRKQI